MRKLLLAALLLTLTACSSMMGGEPWHGSDRPRMDTSSEVRIQSMEDSPYAGLTYYSRTPQDIYVSAGSPNKIRRVIVHELLHAAGFGKHIPDPACYFRAYAGEDLPPLCPQEVAKIRMVTRTFTVIVGDKDLLDAVVWAIAKWNTAAGREVFVLG